MYTVDILIPTARIAFAVEAGQVSFMAEHRPPAAYRAYGEFRQQHPVVGMTTFPNTVLLRGRHTILVDPGLHLQNEPVLRALEARGVSLGDVEMVALTHAHLDHAGACVDVGLPVVVHEAETREPHWAAVRGVMEQLPLRLLSGEEGELADGVGWTRTPGHTEGGVAFRVTTAEGLVVLCGDTVGPLPEDFATLTVPDDEPQADAVLASWRLIRSWEPAVIVPGHLGSLAPADWQS